MKKILVIAVAAMMATVCAKAQNEELKNEIGISYGAGVSLLGDAFGNSLLSGIFDSMANRQWTNDKQFGTLAVEYFRHLNGDPKLAVGGIVTYAQFGEDVVNRDNPSQKYGDRMRRYISVMASVKYSWIDKNYWALYSKLAAGPMILLAKTTGDKTESDNKLYLMGQASLLGVEFGAQVRGFVELGAGEQGIVLAGLKCKF